MKNLTKLLGIIALGAVIGFSFAACGGDDGPSTPDVNTPGGGTGGTFTLTGIPSEYNGKWAYLEAGNNSVDLLGAQNINVSTRTFTFAPITGGSVGIPMWIISGSENNPTVTRYSGNHTVAVGVGILNTAAATFDQEFAFVAERYFTSVAFSGGGATRAWSAGTGGDTPPGGNTETTPTITTSSLPGGTVGTAYSQTLTATGTAPITWSIDSGALPGGLTLSSAGAISGTPTTAGTSSFTVKAANAAGSGTKALSIVVAAGGGSGGPTNWTAVANTAFGTSNVRAIAYGGGTWVAGGADGKMAYSSDGINWTAVADSTFGTSAIGGIAYGSGNFVAVGGGKIAYSTDNGVRWTAIASTGFGTSGISSIAYGESHDYKRFVAVGGDGKRAYSSNGTTWNPVTPGPMDSQSSIYSIAFGNEMFVNGRQGIVNANGTISSSLEYSDWGGVNWTAVANSPFGTGINSSVQGIAYGGGNWAAGGYNGKMASSANGMAWAAVSDSTFGSSTIYEIAYGNGRFVAVGNDGKMAYSSSGTSWIAVPDSTFGTSVIIAIAYGGGKFIAVGADGKMAYSDW